MKSTSLGGTILAILIALLITITNFGIWYGRMISNEQNFSSQVAKGVQQESSRQAIATEVIDKVLEGKPVLISVAGDKAQSIVASILDSSLAETAISKTSNITHKVLTSKRIESDITLDLTTIKELIIPAFNAVSQNTQNINTQDIPDQITIVKQSDIPSLSKTSNIILWATPISFLAAAILMLLYLHLKEGRRGKLKKLGIAFAVVSILTIILFKLAETPALSGIENPNIKIVAENITNSFLETYIFQTLIIIVIGFLIVFMGRKENE